MIEKRLTESKSILFGANDGWVEYVKGCSAASDVAGRPWCGENPCKWFWYGGWRCKKHAPKDKR